MAILPPPARAPAATSGSRVRRRCRCLALAGVLFFWGCDGPGPAAPGPTAPPPRAESLAPASGSPMASPLALTLRGTGLRDAELSVVPPLVLHVDQRSDTLLHFRMSFQGGPPGAHWIRVETRGGTDSIPFAIEPLGAGDTLSETRALWISRWEHHAASPDALRDMIRRAAGAGFNVVHFQTRGNGDAFHRSALEPWSALLTGTLGGEPAWDPLEIVTDEANRLGIELHAWLNAFTGWSVGGPPPESVPRHAFLDHPDWVMVDGDGVPMPYRLGVVRWFSPGHPGVRSRLAAVAAEVVRSYPVAGVHLDFIRYPGPAYSFDAPSLAAWDSMRVAEPALTFDDARRRFVTMAVAEVRDSLDVAAPGRELSAAVWGIYRNTRGWANVSRGFEDRFQDPRRWDALGLVDAVAPMVYWPMAAEYGARLDFGWLAEEHVAGVGATHTWVGMDGHALAGPELARHVERARLAGAEGVAVFSLSALDADPSRWGWLQEGAFRWPARPVPRP
jgi:uncharacterized lipoprotein YddW (UPF0748 family)